MTLERLFLWNSLIRSSNVRRIEGEEKPPQKIGTAAQQRQQQRQDQDSSFALFIIYSLPSCYGTLVPQSGPVSVEGGKSFSRRSLSSVQARRIWAWSSTALISSLERSVSHVISPS